MVLVETPVSCANSRINMFMLLTIHVPETGRSSESSPVFPSTFARYNRFTCPLHGRSKTLLIPTNPPAPSLSQPKPASSLLLSVLLSWSPPYPQIHFSSQSPPPHQLLA